MKQALHIFCKDVRHLWVSISVVLLLVLAHEFFDIRSSPLNTPQTVRANQMVGILTVLLVLGWFYILASAIYEEPLPGDTQFWVTRPYSRISLLAAKLLFAITFFNLPLLISDCCILAIEHLPVAPSALAARQLEWTLLVVLPSILLAVITRSIAQFVVVCLAVILALISELLLLSPQNQATDISFELGGYIGGALVLILSVGAILWQFFTRRTGIARVVLILGWFVVMPVLGKLDRGPAPPRFIGYVPQLRQQFNPATVQIGIGQDASGACLGNSPPGMSALSVHLPMKVQGLPPGIALMGVGDIQLASKQVHASAGSILVGSLNRSARQYCYTFIVPVGRIDMSAPIPAIVRTTMYLTAITDVASLRVPVSQHRIELPGTAGYCELVTATFGEHLVCTTGPYSLTRTALRIESAGLQSSDIVLGTTYQPKEPNRGLSPVDKQDFPLQMLQQNLTFSQLGAALQDPKSELVFTPQTPLGYGTKQLVLTIQDLRLFLQSPN